ncbi:putative cell wall binding repeat 2 [Leifsonia aquatica ATCC 14665]|uniref:Putative cell wall binding repeat 2 n=1 Tax=Leifsonia aquatica ATCC 14665 TaxID=1358026 RepID=U2RUL0_LEIAQ|nr:putative cell wall binding repeat 2 [Leifsonia aquatica ATCC 14665]
MFAAIFAALIVVSGVVVSAAPASAAQCADAACVSVPSTKQAVAAQLVTYYNNGLSSAAGPKIVIPGQYPGIFPNEIQAIANGTVTATCDVDIRALQTILIVARHFGSATITDLNRNCSGATDATCPGSPVHCVQGTGGAPTSAIDFGSIGGLGGPSASSATALFSFMAGFVPQVANGSWTEALCGDGAVSSYIHQFFVTGAGCDHHHIDFRGTAQGLNIPAANVAPIGNFEGATSPSAGAISASGWALDMDSPSASINVAVYLDGVRTAIAPANLLRQDVNNAYGVTGNHGFSVPIAANPGSHTVGVSAIDSTTGAESSMGTRAVVVGGTKPTASRISGGTRYDTAIALSQAAFPTTAPVVYLASGQNSVDAISAGPAAAKAGGPLLLNDGSTILPTVMAEIQRLNPAKVQVVSGTGSIPDAVLTTIRQQLPNATVTRLAGADRFETSRNTIRSAFTSAPVLFVVDSGAWTDAFAAGNTAVYNGEPVLLVNGPNAAIDAASVTLIHDLGTTGIRVIGGPNSVSDAMVSNLTSIVPNTARVYGSDRFETASVVAQRTYTSATTAYIVSGLDYPDGLTAGVISGKNGGPLLLSRPECVAQSTLQTIYKLNVTNVVVIGGTTALSSDVAALKPCGV